MITRGRQALLIGSIALAAAAAPPASAQVPTSQAQYRRAYDAIEKKRWPEARALLLELWSRSRTYDVAASLGQVEYQLKHYPAAAQYMAFAIANVAPKERPANVERYRQALAEITQLVATLRVSVDHASAEVFVNGEKVGVSPLASEVFVEPGVHTLEARLGSDESVKKTLAVESGESYSVALELGALDAETAAALSGQRRSRNTRGAAPARADASRSLIPVYVGTAVTVVGASMAIGFGLAANGAEDDVRTLRRRLGPSGCADGTAPSADCDEVADAVDRQQSNATVSNVGLGVATVAGLGTLGYWLFWPEPADSAARPAVAFGTTNVHVSMVGKF